MAGVSSRVVINQRVIDKLSREAITALEMTGEALHTEIGQAQVVPMEKGTLSGEAFFCDYSQSGEGTVSLVHSTPYARRLYFHPEYNYRKDFHENAKGQWFEDWLEEGDKADFVPKAYASFYRRLTGL